MLSAIVERNGGLQKSCLIDLLDTQAVLAQLAAAVNPDLLDIWEASDLELHCADSADRGAPAHI